MDGRNRDCNLAFVPAALQTRNHPLTAGGAPEPSGRGAIASKASLGPACSVNGTAEPSRSSYHPYARNSLGDGVSRVKDRPQSYVQQGPGYQLSCPSGNGADAWQSTLVYIGADEGQGISHFQPLPAACSRRCSSSSNAAGDSGLRPFPRPRPSVDNLGDSVNSLPAPPPPPSTPNESRILRRQQNQYKRHGSVTLAWQQRLSGSSLGSIKYGRGSFASNADPPGHVRDGASCASQRASRFSSGDGVGELLADTGASPISTPVNTWYRLSQASNSSNNNATPDDSGGMPVCRRGSVRSATIGTPTPARWTSSSFATPGVDHSWGSDSADSGCSNNGLAPSEPQAKRNSQAGGACGRSGARYGDSGGRQPCRRQSCTLFVPVNTSRASASAAQRLRLCEGSSHGEASQLQGGAAIGNGNNGACNANSAEEGDCGSSIGNNREGDKGLATSGSTASAACCHQSSARPSLYSGMNGIPTGDCSAANVAIPGVKDQLIAPRENDNAMGCCAENSCAGMRTTGSSSARSPAHSAYSSSSSIGGFRASSSSASSRGSSMLRSGAGSWETSMVLVMSEAGAVTQGCSSSSSSDRLLTHSNPGASATTTANGAAAATLSEGCAIGRGSSTPHNRSGSHSAENPNPEWLTRPAQQSVAAGGNGRSSSSSNHYHNSTETTAQPGHKHSPLHEAADYSFVPQSLRVSQGQNGPPGADVQADGDGPVRGTERNRNLEAREEGGVGRLRSVASPTASDRAKAKSSASCTFSSSHAVAAKPAGPFFSSSATSPLPPPLCTSTPSSSSSASDSHVTPGRIATVSTSLSSHSRSNSAGSASATPVSQHTLSTSRGYPHSSSLDIETVVGADELSTYTAAHSRQAEGTNRSISFGRSNSSALEKPCKESKDPTRRRHALLLTNPPKQALPLLPEEMTSLSVPSDATTAPALAPALAADEASSAANTTAACTPTDALRCGSGAEKVGKHISMGGDNLFDNAAGVVNSPTHFVVQKKQQRRWPQEALAYVPQEAGEHDLDRDTFKYSSKTGVAGEHHRDSHLQGYDAHSQNDSSDAEDIARHPTLVFDSSPILRASALIEEALVDAESHRRTLHTTDSNQTAASSSGESSSAEDPDAGMRLSHRRIRSQSDVRPTNYGASDIPLAECRASEEVAHELGNDYIPPQIPSAIADAPHGRYASPAQPSMLPASTHSGSTDSPLPRPRPRTANSADRMRGREAAEASLCRNSLFPSVVKQQSRCLSVLLQQGPHGGIRRVGPLLITTERGGKAIELLNPAFIDMMDVQPVDAETAAILKKSNIRRRSFSMPPNSQNTDWFSTLANIIAASGTSAGSDMDEHSSVGPGMWWPLNDDNCSDEVTYDVHMSVDGQQDSSGSGLSSKEKRAPPGLDRSVSSSSLGGSVLRNPQSTPMSRKEPVPSQLKAGGQASNPAAAGSAGAFLRPHLSQGSLSGQAPPPILHHATSDMSDNSASSGFSARQHQQSVLSTPALSMGLQLADVSMRTESGVITRSVKSMSLRLLVNRLASPEGNVDSDLMTDFLNSYRFFAHPIDVMRLIIVRYLNCFSTNFSLDGPDDSDAGDASSDESDSDGAHLTINGWKSRCGNSATDADGCSAAGDTSKAVSAEGRASILKPLPPLARKDGAIIQLRVMNIIKNWIKFHPHDFRLHHRLTRLLLLFLSHIQKQPGRADFVNSIRQKLSSGKLLAVETPSFVASSASAPSTVLNTAVPSQSASVRSSEARAPTFEHARSALDLQSLGTHRGDTFAPHPVNRPETTPLCGSGSAHGGGAMASSGHMRKISSMANMSAEQHLSGPRLPSVGGPSLAGHSTSSSAVPPPSSASRPRHTKKGSSSYFMSLFHHRSHKTNASAVDGGHHYNNSSSSGVGTLSGAGSDLARISQRGDGASTTPGSELSSISDCTEHELCMPNGNMYASDFGSLVMEALAKSGIPTPQTPVGRTLLNYSIANRNPYRINLVGIDPATFAEQLTLLEHELFTRISATEFSLKGRVGNLETILHAMQGAVSGTRSSVSSTGSAAQAQCSSNPANPVPNLTATTSWFNQATYWAVLTVLSEPTTAARALVIKQLIHIAFHCLARRNYYGAFEIAIALDNSAVRRLHETWALIPPLMKDIVSRVLEVLQSRMNFRTYRESVRAAMCGSSGPDEEVFDAVAEQIKCIRTKDMVASSQTSVATSGGVSSAATPSLTSHGTQPAGSSSGFGNLVHGALFGSDDHKQHLRKKSIAHAGASQEKDAAMLTEQDCACIMYAIRIRAASFVFFDPTSSSHGSGSTGAGPPSSHTSAPASGSSRGGRGSAGHLSSGSGRSTNSSGAMASTGASDANDSRTRRARSTSNSGNSNGKPGSGLKQGHMLANGAPLPVVPFVAVHMTDLLHADEANATYSDEHPQKMRSRNPTGPDTTLDSSLTADGKAALSKRRHMRCDSTAIAHVNQAQPLLNIQKFRLITSMLRELCMAQRTKYPYVADMALQQQIHTAVRSIKAQTNDIFDVVQDVAAENMTLARPTTAYSSPFTRQRNGSSASRFVSPDIGEPSAASSGAAPSSAGTSNDPGSFGYPLYQMVASQRSVQGGASMDGSMAWDCADLKDNQELEQRLYDLSRWIEPPAHHR